MHSFKRYMKTAARCVLFFAILGGILYGLSEKIEYSLIHHDNVVQTRNKSVFRIQREKKNSIDVLVVGDSLSYTAFSPMEMWQQEGISSFVCGQSGQKIQETYDILLTAFEKQSPRLVVMESNLLFRGKPGIEGAQETLEMLGNRYFPVFRGHDIWKTWVTNKTYGEESFKGFSFRCHIKSYSSSQKNEKTAQIADRTVDYMEKIAKLCREHDAKLLIVSVPSPANYNPARLDAVRKMARKVDADYLDLNDRQQELSINWKTDTLDRGDHLNLLGAQKVSRFMGRFMANHYHLPDRRTEKDYSDWNQLAGKYQAKAKEHVTSMEKEISQ